MPTPFPISEALYLDLVKSPSLFQNAHNAKQDSYFKRVYAAYTAGTFKIWNWGAFLLSFFGMSPLWFVYKRLYLFAFVHLFLMQILGLFLLYFMKSKSPESILYTLVYANSLLAVLLGNYGNALHLWWAQKWKEKYKDFIFPKGGDIQTVGALFVFMLAMMLRLMPMSDMGIILLLIGAHIYVYEWPVRGKR